MQCVVMSGVRSVEMLYKINVGKKWCERVGYGILDMLAKNKRK